MKDGVCGVTADAIREAIRFLQPGGVYSPVIDTHELAILRRDTPGKFLVVCLDCRALVTFECTARSILVHINKHTEGNDLDAKATKT